MTASWEDEKRDLWRTFDVLATVRPFRYDDPETGQTVALTLSPRYAVLSVGPRSYYFIRETGEFDGVSVSAAPE
jgi:hypothetical protein